MAKLILERHHCRLTYAEYTAQLKTYWSGLRRTVTACVGCRYRGVNSAAHGTRSQAPAPAAPQADVVFNPAVSKPLDSGVVDRRSIPDRRFSDSLYKARTNESYRNFVERRGTPDPRGDGAPERRASGNSDQWEIKTNEHNLHLIWHSTYECGHPIIDREHQELFALANAALDASFGNSNSPQAFRVAFKDVLDHLKLHFVHEETLLEQHGYTRLKAHKAAHREILAKGEAFNAGAQLDVVTLGDLADFTVTVVARHLVTVDRDYFPLFRSK